jgi:hypothetical protein
MIIIIDNSNSLVNIMDCFGFSIDYADKFLYGICKESKKEVKVFCLKDYNIDNRNKDILNIKKNYIEYIVYDVFKVI